MIERELFDDWLIKPIANERLLQVIERYCRPGAHVLVVDDDRSFVQLVQRVLQADGNRFYLRWSYDGRDALSQLRDRPSDLVLLDIAMPSLDGHAVAQILRTGTDSTSRTPIVAVSGLLPELETTRARPCTFAITRRNGFSENELVYLIQSVVRQVKPHPPAPSLA